MTPTEYAKRLRELGQGADRIQYSTTVFQGDGKSVELRLGSEDGELLVTISGSYERANSLWDFISFQDPEHARRVADVIEAAQSVREWRNKALREGRPRSAPLAAAEDELDAALDALPREATD